jgi:DNA mismatch repair protein MutL
MRLNNIVLRFFAFSNVEKLMQRACKSAIKGGDVLNNAQIGALLKSFKDSENKPLQCPHGRPTVIKFSKTDFEKWFKRIV